jgi:hypothetical protein
VIPTGVSEPLLYWANVATAVVLLAVAVGLLITTVRIHPNGLTAAASRRPSQDHDSSDTAAPNSGRSTTWLRPKALDRPPPVSISSAASRPQQVVTGWWREALGRYDRQQTASRRSSAWLSRPTKSSAALQRTANTVAPNTVAHPSTTDGTLGFGVPDATHSDAVVTLLVASLQQSRSGLIGSASQAGTMHHGSHGMGGAHRHRRAERGQHDELP